MGKAELSPHEPEINRFFVARAKRAMRFNEFGTRYILGGRRRRGVWPYALSNVRKPRKDIAGEGFEEHEIVSSAAKGYG
jgi:hypothetical protein